MMNTSSKSFFRGFVKGLLAPLAVVSSLYGLPRQPADDPFRDFDLGSPKKDAEKIRLDFSRAIGRMHREHPETQTIATEKAY